ncbi:MAG: hypothetical protein FWH27_09740 [Planctomycetaceae bacterium]|nr:hypothetical protein [Planctomycetaceae bacterium]
MSDWATLFGYEKIEWEDLVWHWLISDTTGRYGLHEWGTILDGMLKLLSATVDLPLDIHNVKYDLDGESQGVDFVVEYWPRNKLHLRVVGHCHVEMIENAGKREFKGTARFFYFQDSIQFVGENGEAYLLFEIVRTENGKTTWKPVGWQKDEASKTPG